jgi:hypothetical protein
MIVGSARVSPLIFAAPRVLDLDVNAVGSEASAEAGVVTVGEGVGVDLTGAEASAGAGTVAVEISIDAEPLGAQAGAQAAPVSVESGVELTLTGAEASAEAGTVEALSGIQVPLTGAEAAAEAGTVTPEWGSTVSPVGAEASAEAGDTAQDFDFLVDVVGAEAAAEAGAVDAVTVPPTSSISPMILPIFAYGAQSPPVVNLTGAQAQANAGTVTVSTPIAGVFAQLGPMILPGKLRTINPATGDIDVFITGAQANAQAEQLEGANVTIYLDGATAFAGASAPASSGEREGGRRVRFSGDDTSRSDFDSNADLEGEFDGS